MKRILFLALLLSVTASAFAEEVEINGLWYELVSKAKEATVIKYKNDKYYGDIVIPRTVEYEGGTYSVTGIEPKAFYDCDGLTTVTILDGLTSIGSEAFSDCYSLSSVTIPISVTSIGYEAFYCCINLTSINIFNNVMTIGKDAFYYCIDLNSLIISDIEAWCRTVFTSCYSNPLYYAHHLFLNGEEIKELVIPNGLTSLGRYAFYGCSSLNSVTIPNSIISIGSSAFEDCSGLTSVHISDLEAWCNIAFGDNPLSHAKHLFINGEEIKDLVIPISVTSIGSSAFKYCRSLTSITIPTSVTIIGGSAFLGCTGLTSITIPNSVTDIGSYAFAGCTGLTSVKIGNSVKSIEGSAFEYCNGLTSVTIPNNVTSIGSYAFSGCRGLTSVTIPNSVTSIGERAFSGCSGLTTITIGNGIKNIYNLAFAKCEELADVYCYAEAVPSTMTDAFEDSYIDYATLHVPTASIDAYKAKVPWKSFKTIMGLDGTLPDNPEPEIKKCSTPTIAFVDGKLKFSCETEDVEYVSEVTSKEVKKYYSDEVAIGGTYTVSVYAMKTGYDNSDVATLEFNLGAGGEVCDVNKDGAVDVADIATIISRMAGNRPKQ